MGTGRTFNKQPRSRPKKKPIEIKRRTATHKKRLVALGMDEALVSKMDRNKLRELLKRPAAITAQAS